MNFDEVAKNLSEIDRKISALVEVVQSDRVASPALQAAVKEFERKSRETLADLEEANKPVREHIVELEQAGDSAKSAAEAEEKLSDDTKRMILDAHEDVSRLKSDTAA